MVFRISSMVGIVAGIVSLMAPTYAQNGKVIYCDVNENAVPKTFKTKLASPEDFEERFPNYPVLPSDVMMGRCGEFVGEICDDQVFCTMDYVALSPEDAAIAAEEAGDGEEPAVYKCLSFPREIMTGCVQPAM